MSKYLHSPVIINGQKFLTGGSINLVVQITSNKGDYVVKHNESIRFPGMFEAEKKGLKLLISTNAIGIPEIIDAGIFDSLSFILLESLKPAERIKNYWEFFGVELANLHRHSNNLHGLNHNNYIGSLPQSNQPNISGIDFLIQERYIPLVKSSIENKLLTTNDAKLFDLLYKKLPELLPNESASLLHGDLWSGNFLTGSDGKAWLIDPAVYYGYRETDLAMARLFGGFNDEFFQSYNTHFPLKYGWQDRVCLFQIYPLLVHLNLFGLEYKPQLLRAVNLYL